MLKVDEIKKKEQENKYKSKTLDIKYESLPFLDFQSTRYSMTVKVKIGKIYTLSKEKKIPFFNLTSACILSAINEIPEFKKRIINKKVVEFERVTAITPILQEDKTIREIELPPLDYFKSFNEWNDYIQYKKKNIEKEGFNLESSKRDEEPIVNFSCIPWLHFESMTNVTYSPLQIYPVIAWGKLVDGTIPISLTVSHIFFFGYHFKLFYEGVEKYFNNPELIAKFE